MARQSRLDLAVSLQPRERTGFELKLDPYRHDATAGSDAPSVRYGTAREHLDCLSMVIRAHQLTYCSNNGRRA